MKIKDGFIYRQVAGQHVVIPVGENIADFNGIVNLNETAAFMWLKLQEGSSQEQLVAALQHEFDVDAQQALQDVAAFVQDLRELKAIADE